MFPSFSWSDIEHATRTFPLQEWDFEGFGPSYEWDRKIHHVDEVKVFEGELQGRIMDWDPWLTSPLFDIEASPWQVVEIKMKTNCAGEGAIFWTNTTETPYGGFTPGKETPFQVLGDDQWHVYRIFPFWHGEGKIIMLRLDFPSPSTKEDDIKRFAVDWIRILELEEPKKESTILSWDFSLHAEEWQVQGASKERRHSKAWRLRGKEAQPLLLTSPLVRFTPEDQGDWLLLEMSVDRGHSATIAWASEACRGLCSHTFAIQSDGRMRVYNLDMGDFGGWSSEVVMLQIKPSDENEARVLLKRLEVNATPTGPPDVEVTHAGWVHALQRAGTPGSFQVTVRNSGGEVSEHLHIRSIRFPKGMKSLEPCRGLRFEPVASMASQSTSFSVLPSQPLSGPFRIRLKGSGASSSIYQGQVRVEPSLNLPSQEYVPVPQALSSDFEIGAFYFPGWPNIASWARIWPTCPERKPVLGWYDEGNPECVDWQIKWAVENGITFFLVDWYWHQGGQHLDHWLKAYTEARYRSHLKWAIMWANHNPEGSHSEKDQQEVTRFWIDQYFCMPEYYRIEDKPVVMIWSPSNMERDMKEEGGVARLLEISSEMARDAGYKGIWFIAMKWPEASTDAKDIQWLADAKFDMTSIYHFMHHGEKALNPLRFPFELVAQASAPYWKARHKTGILPFLPNLSTGWDSRPWHGDKSTVIYGRTVPLFRRICEEARAFADATGIQRLVLAPLNEWGEGSYAEPCQEFGFALYETVREVFCEKPDIGWPLNFGPMDVGLGPYDLGMPKDISRTVWDFADGAQGWAPMMGIRDFVAEEGLLKFTSSSTDPALCLAIAPFDARQFHSLIVRMQAEPVDVDPGYLQLFWSTANRSTSESSSVQLPLIADGLFRDYELPLAENKRWRGSITGLRLDPGSLEGLSCEIEEILLVHR